MRRLAGFFISLGVAGVCLIPAPALAQDQKPAEPAKAAAPDADAPFKRQVIVRRPMNLERFLPGADRDCRHYFQMEYHFVDKVCALTPEQAKAIAREGERALQKVVRKWAEEILKVRAAGGLSPLEDELELRGKVRGELAEIARKYVRPDQLKCLQSEYEKRAADWRRAGVAAIVELIDMELSLRPEQRDAIGRSLDRNWQENWFPSPDFLLTRTPPMPAIPDEYVVPFLTEAQQMVWKDIPKGRSPLRPRAGVASSGLRADDSLENDVLREARESELRARKEADRDHPKEPAR